MLPCPKNFSCPKEPRTPVETGSLYLSILSLCIPEGCRNQTHVAPGPHGPEARYERCAWLFRGRDRSVSHAPAPNLVSKFPYILAGLFTYCVLVCGTPLPPSAASDQCTRPAPPWRIPDSTLRDSSSTCSVWALLPSQTTFPFFFGNRWCGLNAVRPAKPNSSSASDCQVLVRLPTGDLRELNPAAAHSLSGTRPGHTAARLLFFPIVPHS